MKPNPLAQRLIMIDVGGLLACGVLAAAAYIFGIAPVSETKTLVAEQREFLDQQTRRAAEIEALTAQEQARLVTVRRALEAASVTLYPATDLHKRLETINTLAEGNSLSLHQIDPGDARPDASGKFRIVPIQIAGRGSFADVARFMNELLAMAYPDVAAREITLTAPADPAATPEFVLKLRWYAASNASAAVTHTP